jgi:hypothetical protein
MHWLELLPLQVPDMDGDFVKDCHMEYFWTVNLYMYQISLETLSRIVKVSDLARDIVKVCHMKYIERLPQKVQDLP